MFSTEPWFINNSYSDVLSLVVALYAIKVISTSVNVSLLAVDESCLNIQLTARSSTSPLYTYGWHRAEILAALINGVFLLALCFSIFLEAIQRFFDIRGLSDYQSIAFIKTDLSLEISNPRLIIIVGSLGLASNIFGLFLFHGLLIALYLLFPCSNGKLKNMEGHTDTPTNKFRPDPTALFYLSPRHLLTRPLVDIPPSPLPLYTAIQQQIASPWSKLQTISPSEGNCPLRLQELAGHRLCHRISESLRK